MVYGPMVACMVDAAVCVLEEEGHEITPCLVAAAVAKTFFPGEHADVVKRAVELIPLAERRLAARTGNFELAN